MILIAKITSLAFRFYCVHCHLSSRYHRALMHFNRPHVADLDGADLSQLAALTSLQVLDLARTEVGDAAYAAIGAAVTTVRDLRLQYTHGTADGILGALVILLSLGRVGVREKRGGDSVSVSALALTSPINSADFCAALADLPYCTSLKVTGVDMGGTLPYSVDFIDRG